MNSETINKMYDFTGKSVVITGGTGVLGSELVCGLAGCGANVLVVDMKPELTGELAKKIASAPGKVTSISGDVLNRDKMEEVAKAAVDLYGKVDILVNAAGGNHPMATTGEDKPFFDIPQEAFSKVMDLNLAGTVLPSQIFGRYFAEQKEGIILNVSSMNAFRPLTRIPAYSAAKAAVSNFTQWLAVHMAQEYSPNIRVNALAPGFFLTDQNRFLLTDKESGELTPRGKTILDHTPMARFGNPKDLIGTALWLLSPASEFVTGIVVPVDGGFSAFSGV